MLKKLIALFFFLSFSALKAQDLVITNVNVIPVEGGERMLKNQSVFIKDGIITDILPFRQKHTKNKIKNVIDGTGKYLIPGLADMHVHFPEPKDLDRQIFFNLNLAAGVTCLRSMRGQPHHPALRDSIRQKLILAPDLYISTVLYSDSTTTSTDLKQFVTKAKSEKWDFIKYLSGLDPALLDSAAAYCRQSGIKLAGHVYANDLQHALRISQASIEHYQSLVSAYRKDSINFKQTMDQLIKKNMFVCPTLSFYTIWGMQFSEEQLNQRNGMQAAPAQLRNAWNTNFANYRNSFNTPEKRTQLENGMARSKKGLQDFDRILKLLNDNKVMLLLSPDESAFNVPGFAMVEEMKLYSKAGIGNYDILKISTYNAACFFNAQNEWGSIRKGKKANLVLLDKDPLENIEHVKAVKGTILGGKFYTPETLLKK